MKFLFTSSEAALQLSKEEQQKFTVLLRHGTMQLEFFKPFPADDQQPHRQDEIYIVAKGQSKFNCNGEIVSCEEGDVLFVPAKIPHHFYDMSEDFTTWVIFYGKEGGE